MCACVLSLQRPARGRVSRVAGLCVRQSEERQCASVAWRGRTRSERDQIDVATWHKPRRMPASGLPPPRGPRRRGPRRCGTRPTRPSPGRRGGTARRRRRRDRVPTSSPWPTARRRARAACPGPRAARCTSSRRTTRRYPTAGATSAAATRRRLLCPGRIFALMTKEEHRKEEGRTREPRVSRLGDCVPPLASSSPFCL